MFLGNKLTLENGQETRISDCEFMPCDPDARHCKDPDHDKNFPHGFSYE